MGASEIAAVKLASWRAAVAQYATVTTRQFRDLDLMANLVNSGLSFLRALGVYDPATREHLITASNLGAKFNTFGRIIDRVNTGIYVLADSTIEGDLAVLTKPEAAQEQYQEDRIGLGIIWWAPVVVGVVLVGGVYALLKWLGASADASRAEMARDLVAGDLAAITNPDPSVKKTWEKWKSDNRKQIESANTGGQGLLDKLLGQGSGNSLILIIGLLGAFYALKKTSR